MGSSSHTQDLLAGLPRRSVVAATVSDLHREVGRGEGLGFAYELGNIDEASAVRRRRVGGLAVPGRAGSRRYRARFREDTAGGGADSDGDVEDASLLPPSDWVPDNSCILPYSLGPERLTGEDFHRLRDWIDELPRQRAGSEASLFQLQDRSLLEGGLVGMVRGPGVGELGSAAVDHTGLRINWAEEMVALTTWADQQTDWSEIDVQELLPESCRVLLGAEVLPGSTAIPTDRAPRAIWCPVRLARTSSERCVGCLCAELESREENEGRIRQWGHNVRARETQAWRRRMSSVRHLVFRRHSCVFGSVAPGIVAWRTCYG